MSSANFVSDSMKGNRLKAEVIWMALVTGALIGLAIYLMIALYMGAETIMGAVAITFAAILVTLLVLPIVRKDRNSDRLDK